MHKIENNKQYFDLSFDRQSSPFLLLDHTEFEDCEFNDCDFSEAIFTHCKFLNCTFNRCNLSLIKIPYSHLFEVNFIDCKLVGIDWTQASWPAFHLCAELKFTRSILNDCSFFGLILNELQLDECKLLDVDFREGDFSNALMSYCDFSNSLFMHSNLQHVDFTESTNFSINILENNVSNAKFSRYEALSLLDSLNIELID